MLDSQNRFQNYFKNAKTSKFLLELAFYTSEGHTCKVLSFYNFWFTFNDKFCSPYPIVDFYAYLITKIGNRNLNNVIQKYFRILKPRPNEKALLGKHLKFCLSSIMLVSLEITQICAWQTVFACDKQTMFLKHWQAKCAWLSWWPFPQACLTSKIRNNCQAMFVCFSEFCLRLQNKVKRPSKMLHFLLTESQKNLHDFLVNYN